MSLMRKITLGIPLSAVVLFLGACRGGSNARLEAECWALEGEKAELEAKIEILEMRLSASDKDLAQRKTVMAADRRTREELAMLEVTVERLREDVPRLETTLQETISQALSDRRAAQAGREFASLRSGQGREFTEVKVIRVTEAGIEFHHSSGIARLTADDLTVEQHEEFGIDMGESQRAVASEIAATREYHRRVDHVSARQRAREERDAAMAQVTVTPSPVATGSRPWNAVSGSSLNRRQSTLDQAPRAFGRSARWSGGTTVVYGGTYYSSGNRSYLPSHPRYSNPRALYRGQSPSLRNTRFAFPTPPTSTRPACP
ncbi:MAG: hypothetical protein MUF31_13480 [Akkermansiaceae bacterium]|jgi:hypothetical protein|nr:hypothetical protein [Akkermansiaceae bacterium]